MKLINIIDGKTIETIMYRTNSPFNDREDMLVGYCAYLDEELISLDGDSYSLDDEIEKYKWEDDMLIVWYKSTWI